MDVQKSVDKLDLVTELKRRGVFAYEVADELGCAESAVSNWLNGRRDTLPGARGRSHFVSAMEAVAERKRGDAA